MVVVAAVLEVGGHNAVAHLVGGEGGQLGIKVHSKFMCWRDHERGTYGEGREGPWGVPCHAEGDRTLDVFPMEWVVGREEVLEEGQA